MRNFCLLLLFTLFAACSPALAQAPRILGSVPKFPETPKDTFGTVSYRAFYDYKIVPDPEEPEKKVRGTAILLIGDEALKFTDYITYKSDTIFCDAYRQETEEDFAAVMNKVLALGNKHLKESLVLLPGEGSYIFQSVASFTGTLRYREKLPPFDWQISDETKVVAGFLCVRADLVHGGRSWTAWFTDELPLPYGPYHFGGLPGMILEMTDAKGEYAFTFKGMEKPGDREYPIMLDHGEKLQILPRDEARVIIRNATIKPLAGMSSEVKAYDADGNPITIEDRRRPYNPLELE